MKKILLCLSLCLTFLTGCQTEPQLTKYSQEIFDVGFDTFVQLVAYTDDEETFTSYLDSVRETFIYYNKLFDNYHTYEGMNNLKSINDAAGKEAVTVDAELIAVLEDAKRFADLSNRNYDASMGAVFEIWHAYREQAVTQPALPSEQELQEAATHTGWERIEIDNQNNTVFIKDQDAAIDLGGVAKGYATQVAAQRLKEEGLQHGILNAGGNLYMIGNKPDQGTWNVGVQLPSDEVTDSIATLALPNDISVVTSGDYQRYYMYEGVRYHHIIDPDTWMPAKNMRSVTVITNNSEIADIASTSLFNMTYEEGVAWIESLKQEGIVIDAVWVFDDSTGYPQQADLHKNKDYAIAYTENLEGSITIQ